MTFVNGTMEKQMHIALFVFLAGSPFRAAMLARKESFSSTTLRICSQCDCTSTGLTQCFGLDDDGCDWNVHTHEDLADQTRQLEEAKAKSKAACERASRLTGLNDVTCALSQTPFFDVLRCAPYDFCHDHPEGTSKDHLCLSLWHCI